MSASCFSLQKEYDQADEDCKHGEWKFSFSFESMSCMTWLRNQRPSREEWDWLQVAKVSLHLFVCLCLCVRTRAVLAEELGKGEGSFRTGLQKMMLDGSLQEVFTILSKALYGEPLVNSSAFFIWNIPIPMNPKCFKKINTPTSALLKNGIMAKDMTRLKILLSELEVRCLFFSFFAVCVSN